MDEVEERLHTAQSLLADGRLTEAESLIDDLLTKHPESGAAWCLKGDLRRRQKDHAGCARALEEGSRYHELTAEQQLHLAEAYAELGRKDLAVWLMRDVPQKPDSNDCVVLKTAAALGRLGESSAALELCLVIRERSPDRAEPAFGVAYYMNRIGKPADEVLPHLRDAHELDSKSTMYRVSYALCLHCLGRSKQAYELIADLDLRKVEWPHCLTRLMEIFAASGDQSRYLDCQARLRQLGDPTMCTQRGDPELQ
jgi:tetratricopeptide (TPR) repeat protein